MLVIVAAITSWCTLITTVLVFWRTLKQDKVLDTHTEKIEKIASGVNGGLADLHQRAEEMRERCDRTEDYARKMERYANRLRKSLAIIEKAEKAGEHVVSLHAVVASAVVQEHLEQDPPVMLDP